MAKCVKLSPAGSGRQTKDSSGVRQRVDYVVGRGVDEAGTVASFTRDSRGWFTDLESTFQLGNHYN